MVDPGNPSTKTKSPGSTPRGWTCAVGERERERKGEREEEQEEEC